MTYYSDDHVTLWHGDCLDVLATLPDRSVDAVCTDPPYNLAFMGRTWDTHPDPFSFQAWCEGWAAECRRILKPGGHLLAFGGTRTWHRLAVAIEDAGFDVRDSLAWLHGQGFPKGKEQLKPAFEPIVMARKPIRGTVAANVLEHGTGALNIDGCRIGTTDALVRPEIQRHDNEVYGKGLGAGVQAEPAGRWPANVVLDEDQATALDEQSGIQKDGTAINRNRIADDMTSWYGTRNSQTGPDVGYGGAGGASRFFYTAKADAAERITHNGISHPTVKPLDLMRWLVRLVTPPGGTILEPFAGSGTTVEAALLEGFKIIAIERETDYLPLITQRINRRRDPIAYLEAAGDDLGLFGEEAS